MPAIHEIEKAVLALPRAQRVLLAKSFLSSLPPVGEEWPEAPELAEAERRNHEIEGGQVKAQNHAKFWGRVEASRKK